MAKKILGISAYYHDAAAVILENGEIIAAAHEERFTRKKHDPSFPSHAISFCLDYSGLSLKDIDAVVFYDKPWLKFERLLQTYYSGAPRGLASFLLAMPVWIKDKFFAHKTIVTELLRIEDIGRDRIPLLFSNHHLSHAASAFYPSPFNEAAILTVDGVGEWATSSISKGSGKDITLLKEMHFPHSVGLLYSAFTYYLGFKVNSGEYKLMGLSPYGNGGTGNVQEYIRRIYETLVELKDDGSIALNQRYFNYATGLTMVHDALWEKLFGFPRRRPESEITAEHCDLALAIQKVTEEIMLRMGRTARQLTGAENLVLAGGTALNCVANARLRDAGIFKNIWVQPAAGDAGGALGAAYAAHHLYFDEPRAPRDGRTDAMQGSYLGPDYGDRDVRRTARKHGAAYRYCADEETLCGTVADAIAQGKVVGWFQGRMEWGPRSLGNRSILGDARSPEMQKRLNLKIKYRESFRPFAPAVLAESLGDYFETATPSPYMLFVADVKKGRRHPLPDGYERMTIKEKLYYQRSDIPAITHLDYSARLQTVHRETNPRFWKLLERFKAKTGCGVMVNTSFNVRGEPIVCTPDDAYRCFMRTEMDCLVLGNFVFFKEEQPAWKEEKDWKEDFTLD